MQGLERLHGESVGAEEEDPETIARGLWGRSRGKGARSTADALLFSGESAKNVSVVKARVWEDRVQKTLKHSSRASYRSVEAPPLPEP